jgi:hypothetical protein
MTTLSEAWQWYEATRRNLERMQRLGRSYWDGLDWETGGIGRDDEFRTLESADIVAGTEAGLRPINDLAVLVLFSAFESIVRDFLVDRIQPEADGLTDPVLRAAAATAVIGVKEGSFFRNVLEPLREQARVSPDLVTRVNQVRDYRNWVAHGRRDRPKNNITPDAAYKRLREFLAALGIATESERVEPPEYEPVREVPPE